MSLCSAAGTRKLLLPEAPRLCAGGGIPAFWVQGDKAINLLCWHPAAYQVGLADRGAQSCTRGLEESHRISGRSLHPSPRDSKDRRC